MKKKAIIIGAGIVGLAAARSFALKNYEVHVYEKDSKAVGASIRNFGMVWPIGQPAGLLLQRALISASIWKSVLEEGKIWHQACGSILNAYHPLEMQVLEEFYESNHKERPIQLMNPELIARNSPASNTNGLLGGLWSPTEVIVDPREAIPGVAAVLAEKYGVQFHFGACVHEVGSGKIFVGKKEISADVVVICSGSDFETLYPEVYAETGITKCKLQMMRTAAQPDNWNAGPALSAGLTLTHYGAFKDCKSLPAYQEYVNETYPEYVKWGIHVMISQQGSGVVTIGDSHEYGPVHDPFIRREIDELILDYLAKFVQLKDMSIAEHWYGVYAKLPGATEFIAKPDKDVYVVNGLSGAGMTLSFGLMEELLMQWGV